MKPLASQAAARPSWWSVTIVVTAAVTAASFSLALACRRLGSADLGYHLAYGERFWQSGQVVQDASFISPPPDLSPDDLPPGAWIDTAGDYHFPNANWLTQVIFAGLKRLGGWTVLNLLGVALVGVILACQAGTIRRLGAGWAWVPAVWLATGLLAYERFDLRPELLGYACLMAQVWLLAGRLTWLRVLGAGAVQLVAANVHSYWLLGLALATALAFDGAARLGWEKLVVQPGRGDGELRRRLRLALASVVLMAAPAFIHPAGWRNALLPMQTVAYLRQHDIAGSTVEDLLNSWRGGQYHPWATIGEFYAPFVEPLRSTRTTVAYAVLLALTAPAALVLLARRRWEWVLMLGLFVAISLSMRRNIAAAGMVACPLIAWAADESVSYFRRRGRSGPSALLPGWASRTRHGLVGLVAMLAAFGTATVVNQSFYLSERREWRFGLGLSPITLPLESARWLDEHLPSPVPVFTDYNASSNVLYFSQKTSGVPVLTNTWAMPSGRMATVVDISTGREELDPAARHWGMDAVVLRVYPSTQPLLTKLLASTNWMTVDVQPGFATFLRTDPVNPALAHVDASPVTEDTLDIEAFAARCRASDPLGLRNGAVTLQRMGWDRSAEKLWRECLHLRDDLPDAWLNLGTILAKRGNRKLRAGEPAAARPLLHEARGCFEQALRLKPKYEDARKNLSLVETDLQALPH